MGHWDTLSLKHPLTQALSHSSTLSRHPPTHPPTHTHMLARRRCSLPLLHRCALLIARTLPRHACHAHGWLTRPHSQRSPCPPPDWTCSRWLRPLGHSSRTLHSTQRRRLRSRASPFPQALLALHISPLVRPVLRPVAIMVKVHACAAAGRGLRATPVVVAAAASCCAGTACDAGVTPLSCRP